MSTLQSPRGTRDILPDEQRIWEKVKASAVQVAQEMSYQPISIPTYEELQLFQRAMGEGTDIQDKELFLVRGKHSEESYALRPEATAGIVRAFVQHGMHTWPQPVKLYTFVSNFRYDRPQKGRYREHVQFDIEYFGDKNSFADAWVIYAGWRFLQKLGLRGIGLKLNSLGTLAERQAYAQALSDYFKPLASQLSEDSQKRLLTNPLRILDSKDDRDQKLSQNAPRIESFFSSQSTAHFQEVQNYLQAWKIPYVLDSFLVRGLDYYCHTAFEWVSGNQEGQQASLGGGGRYDNLLTQLDGPDVGAVGSGLGLDRIVEEMTRQNLCDDMPTYHPQAYIVAADGEGKQAAISLVTDLLSNNIKVDLNLSKESLGSQLKAAHKSGADFAIILGKAELDNNMVTLKDLRNSSQKLVSPAELVEALVNEA